MMTSYKVHLLRGNRTTACGLKVKRGINYQSLGTSWDDYSVVSCLTCKGFLHRLKQKAKNYRR